MAKSKSKTISKQAKNRPPSRPETIKPRQLKQPHYKSFRLNKRIKHPNPKLSSSFSLLRQTLRLLRDNWKLFGAITVIYGLLTLVLVRGFSSSGLNLSELKETLQQGLQGGSGQLATGASLFSYLLGSAGSSSTPTGGVYQTFIIIITSLAIIWALRQVLSGKTVKAKDAFYQGLYPLAPFILVLVVIGLQLMPFAIGSWLYTALVGGGIAVTAVETVLWTLIFFLLSLLSLYMLCSSIFALYIVTLPDVAPLQALRSARELARHRRFTILRKILFLPLILFVIGAVVMIPLILVLTPVAEWIFFVFSMFILVLVHAYTYTLYRELL